MVRDSALPLVDGFRQTSLPAELRHRWGIEGGGEVGFVDLGAAALIVPGGIIASVRASPTTRHGLYTY